MSLRTACAASVALLAVACSGPRVYGPGVELETLFYGGYRAVGKSDVDGHPAYAAEVATNDPQSQWGYELTASVASDDFQDSGVQHDLRYEELALGMRRSWGEPVGLRAVVGFGGAITRLDHRLHDPTREFTDNGGAAYAHAGVHWVRGEVPFDPGTNVLVGFDLRALAGDDYDYAQLALVIGFIR